MKIKRVKWINHPVLGSLELDFTNPSTGEPFDTVLFAGENGTGKTTILETISTFLNRGTFEPFEIIEYIVDGRVYKAVPQQRDDTIKTFYNIIDEAGSITQIYADKSNSPQLIETNRLDIRHHGCVFSKARADYKTKQITSTTTKQLDIEKYDVDNEDDFTSSKQLIVDVQNQDNSEYAELNKELGANPQSWDTFYPNSKIFRFKNAFDSFFHKMKYDKVADSATEKSILFKKNNNSISIDTLSTGEKQIVFRGIYLLKNTNKLEGAVIMIDEPELSMHPKWQKNILQYYKQLFTQNGTQRAQLCLATHSEYVLEEALSNQLENLIIVLTEVNGEIQTKRIDAPSVLPSITAAETNYLAFDIVSNDYHIELYGWLQEKQGNLSVKGCDNYIKGCQRYSVPLHEKTSSHGANTYDTLSSYIRNAIHHPNSGRTFTENELRTSIELLIELCR